MDSRGMDSRAPRRIAAEDYLDALAAHGIDHLFVNPGTDFAPIVEAFAKEIPVLAYAATAVPATMDGAGVLYDNKDPRHVASLMDAIVSDTPLQDGIGQAQLAAVQRLQAKDFAGTLLGFVDDILASPRTAAPCVAYDFWQQIDTAQELEELRMYRPSAYKGLPSA